MDPRRKKIVSMMQECGCAAHLKGFDLCARAIELVADDPEFLHHITSELYPQLAEEFDTTESRVERAIRHLIEVAFFRAQWVDLQKYFGNSCDTTKCKATNGEFIAALALHLRMEE